MFQEKYDNSLYWLDIHKDYAGTLRAVGWPTLCEEFNKLKYISESDSFLTVLNRSVGEDKKMAVLEVGVGIGYWTSLLDEYCRRREVRPVMTALDISAAALALVKEKFPEIETLQADLKKVNINSNTVQYDLVTAVMVLLHLTDIEDYLHALKFCAQSVKAGGYFVLYEPLLQKNYSPFISIKYDVFSGNSIPRNASEVDNVLKNAGMEKCFVFPGASWLLNSPIQASSRMAYLFKWLVWNAMARLVFKSDRLTRLLSGPLLSLDKYFKASNPDSGTFALYRKIGPS
jgi:2-polyprenyl-3-methyl-5-hydroxy-6-metoxy-1,4-benzoquinol methylase